MWIRTLVLASVFTFASCTLEGESVQNNNPNKQETANPYTEGNNSDSQEKVSYPPNSHIRLGDIQLAINNLVGEESEKATKEAEERSKADLKAQQQMSKWTFWMFVVSVGGFFLGILGTVLIGWTLHETRKASGLTKEALDDTRITSYKELRAYIGIDLKAVPIDHGDDSLAVAVRFENQGQTPAYDIKITHTLHNSPLLWGPEKVNTTAILNPSEHFTPVLKSKFKNVEVVSATENFFLNLHIVFTDMNGNERWVKCIFSKEGEAWPKFGPMTDLAIGNAALFERPFSGDQMMYLRKMETGDLTDKPYEM